MHPLVKIGWHFGGLFLAIIGAWALAGWPAAAVVFGGWAVIATISDIHSARG